MPIKEVARLRPIITRKGKKATELMTTDQGLTDKPNIPATRLPLRPFKAILRRSTPSEGLLMLFNYRLIGLTRHVIVAPHTTLHGS